jgi:hypothetical protein
MAKSDLYKAAIVSSFSFGVSTSLLPGTVTPILMTHFASFIYNLATHDRTEHAEMPIVKQGIFTGSILLTAMLQYSIYDKPGLSEPWISWLAASMLTSAIAYGLHHMHKYYERVTPGPHLE